MGKRWPEKELSVSGVKLVTVGIKEFLQGGVRYC